MTPLRERMIEDMQWRGLSASTPECYVNAVRGLAGHFHRSPDELCEEDLREYYLYLANEKKIARSRATVAICGIKFLYERTLRRQWTTLGLVRPPRLTTIYACGLRASEEAHLRVDLPPVLPVGQGFRAQPSCARRSQQPPAAGAGRSPIRYPSQ